MSDCLKNIFPHKWIEIQSAAFLKLIYKIPLKNIEFRFGHSFLSDTYSKLKVTDKSVGQLLKSIGGMHPQITQFFKHLLPKENDNYFLIDATHLLTNLRGIDITKISYNSKGEYSPKANLMFIYSESLKTPVFYRLVPGNIREAKAFRLTLDEISIKDAVTIADKGFYSENNIAMHDDESMRYITPLRRNSHLIDYEKAEMHGMKGFSDYFKFNERFIWHYTIPHGDKLVHLYLDPYLRNREEIDYLNSIGSHPETHNKTDFQEVYSRLGTLAIYTNCIPKNPEEIYIQYKNRNGIELMIDALENTLQADHSHMQNNESLEG